MKSCLIVDDSKVVRMVATEDSRGTCNFSIEEAEERSSRRSEACQRSHAGR